jgi:hypothetical protein
VEGTDLEEEEGVGVGDGLAELLSLLLSLFSVLEEPLPLAAAAANFSAFSFNSVTPKRRERERVSERESEREREKELLRERVRECERERVRESECFFLNFITPKRREEHVKGIRSKKMADREVEKEKLRHR